MVLCCWKGGKDLFPALPPSSQGFKKGPPANPTNLGVMPCWSVKGSWFASWMKLRKNKWPQMYFPSGLRHSHCVIGGLTLTLIHVIQRKSPYERRGAGETAKCLSGNGIPPSKKILRWKQKHKPRRLATTIFRATPGWPRGDSPGLLSGGGGSPPPHWPPGLLPSPSLQALAHALTERGLEWSSVLPTLEGLLPEPPYYHHPLFLRATPLLSGPGCRERCLLPPPCSSSSDLSPSGLSSPSCPALSVPSAFPLGQMSITNGLESEEAGISRTPIRSL